MSPTKHCIIACCQMPTTRVPDRQCLLWEAGVPLVTNVESLLQERSSPTVSWAGGKDYARGTNFNCMATSGGASARSLRNTNLSHQRHGLQERSAESRTQCIMHCNVQRIFYPL